MENTMTSSVNFINELDVATTAHQHGLHVSGSNDGGPQSRILPGQSRTNVLEIDQPAGTHWYHPHPHGKTGEQVINGLAGLIIIQDQNEINTLPNLPRDYGVNDFPVIIQDKTFNADGSVQYDSAKNYGKRGYLGENILVNGKIEPTVSTPTGWVRFRILNGSNARFYERDDSLSLSNNQAFYVIASDGGLLEAPVQTTSLPIGPGERYEIMVELTASQSVNLRAGKRSILKITADLSGIDNSTANLPHVLASIPSTLNQGQAISREFVLGGDMTIKGKKMKMAVINEAVTLGTTEVWYIHGKGARHTVHVHGCSFLVIDRDGANIPAWEKGWKDTVIVSGKRPVRVLVKFNQVADRNSPYMYHCHMLEHEDMGMMGQFTVM
jgi:FtsP/CotA-like multicopper oxidase with cupredoxin domain